MVPISYNCIAPYFKLRTIPSAITKDYQAKISLHPFKLYKQEKRYVSKEMFHIRTVSYMNQTLAITNAVCRFPFRFEKKKERTGR